MSAWAAAARSLDARHAEQKVFPISTREGPAPMRGFAWPDIRQLEVDVDMWAAAVDALEVENANLLERYSRLLGQIRMLDPSFRIVDSRERDEPVRLSETSDVWRQCAASGTGNGSGKWVGDAAVKDQDRNGRARHYRATAGGPQWLSKADLQGSDYLDYIRLHAARRSLYLRGGEELFPRAELLRVFSQYGAIESVFQGHSKTASNTFCFVVMRDDRSASRALRETTWELISRRPVSVSPDKSLGERRPRNVVALLEARVGHAPPLMRWLRALSERQRELLADEEELWETWVARVGEGLPEP